MTLTEFLHKWEAPDSNKLSLLIHFWFGCDIRTFYRWKNRTPRHVQVALVAVDKLWTATGKDYSFFLEEQ